MAHIDNQEQHCLFVSWKSKPPLEGINVWRVEGDIEYKDGKLVFTISNGNRVSINPEQIVTIGTIKTEEQIGKIVDEIIKNNK